jgi:hypothetical protein
VETGGGSRRWKREVEAGDITRSRMQEVDLDI